MVPSTDTRPRSDWRPLALTVSVVINLFLAALVGGYLLRVHLSRVPIPEGETPMAAQLARVEAAMSPPDAAAFGSVIEREKPSFALAAQQLIAARRALDRRITADPFDRQAASEALADYRASWSRFVADFSGPLIEALSKVSPEGRRRLIAARQRRARDVLPGR